MWFWEVMDLYNNGKRNSWTYNKSLKHNIENNEFVKKIRKKLIKDKWTKRFNQ